MRRAFVVCVLAASLATAGVAPSHAALPQASGLAVAQTALSYRGYPYATVGDTPAVGFSCVGFTHFVYAQYGIWLPEDVGTLAARYPYVAPQNLQPGDLLLFSNTEWWNGYSHAAIYLGNGQMIGADNFMVGVSVSSIYDPYWYAHWTRSVRVLSY